MMKSQNIWLLCVIWFCAGFLLGTVVPTVSNNHPARYTKVQQGLPAEVLQQLFGSEDVPDLPEVNMTLADAIDIMAEYQMVDGTQWLKTFKAWGMTDPDSRTIYISHKPDNATSRDTVIHEWLHVMYGRMGIDTSGPYEPQIAKKAHQIYMKLWGPKEAQ